MCQEIFEAGVPRSDVAKAESLVKSLTRSPTRSLAVAGLRILEVDVLIVLFCLSRSFMILWDVHGFGKFLQSTRVYEGSTSSLHSWRRRCNSHTMFGTQKTSRLKWNCAQKRFWFFELTFLCSFSLRKGESSEQQGRMRWSRLGSWAARRMGRMGRMGNGNTLDFDREANCLKSIDFSAWQSEKIKSSHPFENARVAGMQTSVWEFWVTQCLCRGPLEQAKLYGWLPLLAHVP